MATLRHIVLLLLVLLMTHNVSSAEYDSITGRVLDPSGNPISDVNIIIPGTPRGTATDPDGLFNLPDLPPADYTIVAAHLGYLPDTLSLTVAQDRITQCLIVLHEDILELQGVELVIARETAEDQATSGRIIFRRREVKELPGGAEDPLRAFTLIPGITARDPDDSDWSVRGAGMDEMRVLLDGIPLPQPTHFGVLSRSLSIFNPLVVDRFELWKGGMPVSYGRAVGGLLKVETIDTESDELHGSAVLTYLTANLGWQVPFTESVNWVNGIRMNYDPGVYRYLEEAFRDRYVKPTLRDAQGVIRWNAGGNHKLNATYLWSYDRLESESFAGAFDHRNRLLAGGLGWTWIPVPGWISNTVAYGWHTNETLHQLDLHSEESWMNTRVGIRGENTILISPGSQLITGGVIEGEKGNRRDPLSKTDYDQELLDLYYALFLEGKIHWGRLHTTAGVRSDFYDWWLYQDGTLVDLAYHLYRINPRIALGYYLTENIILKSSWGTFTQPRDTAIYDATHWSAGIEYQREGWSGEITAFLHDREYDYEGIRRYANGVEALVRRQTGSLTGWVGASLSVSEREAKNLLEPTALDRRWSVLGAVLWNMSPGWRFSSQLVFGTCFPTESVISRTYVYSGQAHRVNRGWIPEYGQFGTARLPEIFRWDLKAAHDITLIGLDATVFAEIINATAHPNVVDYQYSDDVTVRQAITEFPTFLPLLGLEVRF